MVQNIAKVTRQIMAFPAKVKTAVKAEMARQADEVVRLAKQFAPEGDTGNLRDSIGWVWGTIIPKGSVRIGGVGNDRAAPNQKSDMVITIFAGNRDAFYARWQEFGTQAMTANPFFYPAYRLRRRKIRAGINKAIRTAIKQGF